MMFALLSLAMYSQAAAVLVRYMPPVKPPAMMVAMLLMWCRGSEWPSTDTVCLGASPSLTQALATVLTCSQYSEKLVSRSRPRPESYFRKAGLPGTLFTTWLL